jgi:hypothetical protein
VIARPAGEVVTVTGMEPAVHAAVSLIGAFMLSVAGLFVPEYDPVPVPVQPPKLYPAAGVAEI